MAKVASRPFFLGGNDKLGKKGVEYEFLLEENGFDIGKWSDDDDVIMLNLVPWTERHAELARQYKVTSAQFGPQSFGDRENADFLLELPTLREVSIALFRVEDLSALGRLTQLRSLRIDLEIWRMGDNFSPVDFSALEKLEHADMMMCPAFESVLDCKTIKELAVRNECDGRLRDLDLSRLPRLQELELDHCPKLRSVSLHPKAQVQALSLALCGSYKIDWRRMGPDLLYLRLGGRLTFPLEDILNAPRLRELHTIEIRKLPPLGFLRKLERLRTVFLFAASGPKVSAEDDALVREINARPRHSERQVRRKAGTRPSDVP